MSSTFTTYQVVARCCALLIQSEDNELRSKPEECSVVIPNLLKHVIKLDGARYSHYKSFTINDWLILRLVFSYEANRHWCQRIWRILVSCNQSFITVFTRACHLLQWYSSISLFINHYIQVFLIARLKLRIYQSKIKKIIANETIRHSYSELADLVTIFICGLLNYSVSNSDYTASSGK